MIAKGKMDDEFVPNRQCCMFGLIFVQVNRERLSSFQHITFQMILMCISYTGKFILHGSTHFPNASLFSQRIRF